MEQREDTTAPARIATSPQAPKYVDHEAALPLEDDLRIAKTASAPRGRVTLHQLSFWEHSDSNLAALGRFDRLCLRFLKFVVARRAFAFCVVTGFYVALAARASARMSDAVTIPVRVVITTCERGIWTSRWRSTRLTSSA